MHGDDETTLCSHDLVVLTPRFSYSTSLLSIWLFRKSQTLKQKPLFKKLQCPITSHTGKNRCQCNCDVQSFPLMRIRNTKQETKGDNLRRCVHICCRKEKKPCGMSHLTMNGVMSPREDEERGQQQREKEKSKRNGGQKGE